MIEQQIMFINLMEFLEDIDEKQPFIHAFNCLRKQLNVRFDVDVEYRSISGLGNL